MRKSRAISERLHDQRDAHHAAPRDAHRAAPRDANRAAPRDAHRAAPRDEWPLFDRPGFLARRVHQIHGSLFAEICGSFGVTPVQYSVLSALAECGTADQTTLARIVALDRTTTTGALKRLESRGFVQRFTSEEDRRSQSCKMTVAGRGLLARMEASARRAHEATVAMLSEKERAQLIILLKKIVAVHDERRQNPDLL